MLCEGHFHIKANGQPKKIDKFTWSLTGSGKGNFAEPSTNSTVTFTPTKESASEDGTTIKVTYSVDSSTADTTLTIPRHAKTTPSSGHLSSQMVDRNTPFHIFHGYFNYEMDDQFGEDLTSSDKGGAIPTIIETGSQLGMSNLRLGPPKIQKNYKLCPKCVFTDEVGLNKDKELKVEHIINETSVRNGATLWSYTHTWKFSINRGKHENPVVKGTYIVKAQNVIKGRYYDEKTKSYQSGVKSFTAVTDYKIEEL